MMGDALVAWDLRLPQRIRISENVRCLFDKH
jgi:hypothetical protein